MQKFYEELLANYENPQKKVLATVIESSKSDEDRGLKFILNAGEPAVISRSGADFIQKLDFSKYSSIDEPLLEEIELSDGNKLEVFFQPLVIRPHLYIFGAGHVAQPLAGVSKLAGFKVTVVDDRVEFASRERFPEADQIVCRDFMEYLEDLTINHDDYLVIVTRGHQYDYEILKQVIKSKARYIGMIGSTHKRNQIYKKLQSGDGIKKNYINRVFSPIGLDIGSETPAEIAIAIAAELVKIRRAGPGGDLDG